MTTILTIFSTSTKKLEDIVGRDLKELIPTLGIQDPRLDELMQTWDDGTSTEQRCLEIKLLPIGMILTMKHCT